MRLETSGWQEFEINRLFNVEYGNSLELDSCEETTKNDPDGVNFVARTRENNGVTAIVKRIPGIEPSEPGIITVAGSGSSTLSTFVQESYFYSGYHLFLLVPKDDYSWGVKQFVCICLELDKYKYWYGRQANKTLPFIKIRLPIRRTTKGVPIVDDTCRYSDYGYVPDFQFMEDYIKSLHHKPLTTKNKVGQVPELNVPGWKYFLLNDICKITMGNKMDFSAMSMDEPKVNFVGRSEDNNGIAGVVDIVYDKRGMKIEPYQAGCITVALGGSLGSTYLQDAPFYTSQNVSVLEFPEEVSNYAKLFLCTLIHNESRYKYFPFGRELNTHIRKDFGFTLPVDTNGNPDWQFMEHYIKSLPYGDRLEG